MLRHVLSDASWVNSLVSKYDIQKRGKPAGAVRRAALASVESLERRQLLSSGQLDTSFGAGGQVELPAQGTIYASAVQSDGKIILAGGTLLFGKSGTSSFLLERVTPNGTLDTTFGTNGVLTTSFPATAQASSVAIESDGKIIVGGGVDLARYNANGSLDTTFGTGGKVIASAASDINIQSLAVTPANKVVVGGRTTYQDPAHPSDPNYALSAFSVARFDADGTLDASFNSTGTFIEQISDIENGTFTTVGTPLAPTVSVALQPDGKLLVGSNFKIDPAVWRLNVDGTLDTSFGRGGMATIPLPDENDFDEFDSATITQLVVQPDGKILAGGFANQREAQYNGFAVARFNADGSPDTTFGNTDFAPGGGLIAIITQFGTSSFSPQSASILLQSDGKIIIGGSSGTGEDDIDRLTANGAIDSTFSFASFSFDANFNLGLASGHYPSLDLTPGGHIVLADNPQVTGDTPNSPNSVTGLIRVQNDYVSSTTFPASTKTVTVPAGGINPTFGAQGDVIVRDQTTVWAQSSPQRTVRATAVQPDGRILIAGSIGTVSTSGICQIFVERLNADGSTDTTFGTNGFVETAIGAFSIANSIGLQSDGKIVIGGLTEDSATSPTNQQFALARYTTAGVLDTTFGTSGTVTTDFTGNEQIDAIVIESGGQIVAAGSYFQNPDIGFHVVRYTSSGLLDTSFNSTGKLTVDLGPPASGAPAFPTSLAVQSDGKILIGSRSGTNAAIYRYNTSGTIDSGFGSSGIALNPSTSTGGSISAITVLANGKIVAAAVGLDPLSTPYPINLMRFSSAGIADSTFGTGGATVLDFGSLTGGPESEPLDPTFPTFLTVDLLVPQADGGIIAVGARADLPGGEFPVGLVPLVTKVTSDGSADSSFTDSADPGFVPPPHYRGEVVRAAAVAPDGSIIVAADVYANTINNPPMAFDNVTSPHWIGVTNYITQSTHYQITIPAGGVDFTPTTGGGGGGGGGGGNPLPVGQLTAKILTRLPAKALGGTRDSIDVQVTNAGTARFTGPVVIELFESTDETLGADDTIIKTLTIGNVNLSAKGSRTIHVPFVYAPTLATGNYTILADVIESNAGTAGYVAASSRPVTISQAVVDLQVSFVPPKPVTLKAHKKNQVTLQIKNLGNTAAVGTYNVFLDGSPTTNSGDFISISEFGIHRIHLNPKQSRLITFTFNVPASLGTHFYLMGSFGLVSTPPELNFSNNQVIEPATLA